MTRNARMRTPVTRNLRTLFSEPLPREPVIVHMTADEWKKLSEDIPISRTKIRKDAKGMFVTPDPFGGYLGAFACAAGSKEGLACIPEIVRSGGTITFGSGCRCIGGKDEVDKPVVEPTETCSLGIRARGGFACTGTCSTGRTCKLVKVTGSGLGGSRTLITCECS